MTTTLDRQENERIRHRRWWWIALAAIAFLAAGFAAGVLFRPYVFSGSVIQSSEPAPPMTGLVFDDGTPVDLKAMRGDVVLVYFGYTHCPDLCPTMLSTVHQARNGLGADAHRVHMLMVTVDPGRDHIEDLGDYVRHFDEDFRGVWGPEPDVRSVATRYGIHYSYEDEAATDDYLVAHTASLLAIDPDGALRLLYQVGVTAEDLERDLREMIG